MSTKPALSKISEVEYLKDAWRAINKSNLRSRGLDDVKILNFKAGLERNLSQISAELRAKSFVFHKLRPHAMEKLGSAEKRPLRIAAVRDRVVMKAIAQFISPSFQKFNLPCSFAYVKYGGVDAAVRRINELTTQGCRIYFQADIIKFFDSVDKELLWRRFAKHVRHRSLLPLIRQCFDLEVGDIDFLKTEDQELFTGSDSGIPQGGCLSPMLANFYLFDFDKALTGSGFGLVRYADDFLVMCESRERAECAYELCSAKLNDLGLKIHPLGSAKTTIGEFSKGLNFLGLHFMDGQVFPAEKSKNRFRAKIEETLKPHSGVSLPRTLQKLSNLIRGWGKYYSGMQVGKSYPALDEFIRESVRTYLKRSKVILVDRKWPRQRKFLGIPSLTAMAERERVGWKPAARAFAASHGATVAASATAATASNVGVGAA
jgi:RNA-directed DNA polymerase